MIFGARVGHDALFDEVCRSIELDKKTKTLLQSVLKKHPLAQPAKIFIEPDTMMKALNDPDFSEENDELKKLYNSWFTDQRKGR
ncbi:MAG: hypothetical protein FWG73_09565 [Planctomycetaceae bacterium]|nr:hypothetical protein [Planctomycetaceae bacterium]